MSDQADKLRQISRVSPLTADGAALGPPMIVVAGGRSGVGVTTVAVNLAAALVDVGRRVVLVDAATVQPAVARISGILTPSNHTIDDILAGKCTATSALVPGPAGIQILPNAAIAPSCRQHSRHAQQRLMNQLRTLSGTADLLVVDAGSGLTQWTRRFWQQAQLVLLVTTAEDAAIVDTYAVIKRAKQERITTDVRMLANQHERDDVAEGVQRRLETACQRFLGCDLRHVPSLPLHGIAGLANPGFSPRVWEAPDSPFGHAVLWLGHAVDDVLGRVSQPAVRHKSLGVRRTACTYP